MFTLMVVMKDGKAFIFNMYNTLEQALKAAIICELDTWYVIG